MIPAISTPRQPLLCQRGGGLSLILPPRHSASRHTHEGRELALSKTQTLPQCFDPFDGPGVAHDSTLHLIPPDVKLAGVSLSQSR